MEETLQPGLFDDGRTPFIAPEPEPSRTPFISDDATAPISGDSARYRAMKMHIAMGDNSPGIDAIENSIINGREATLRRQVATTMSLEKRQKMEDNIKMLAQKTNIVDPRLAAQAAQMIQNPESIDPEVAPEEGFSEKYTKETLRLIDARRQRIAQKAFDEDTDAALDSIKGTDAILARREIARVNAENAKAEYDKQSKWQYAKNISKGLVPGLNALEKSADWNPANVVLPGFAMQDEVMKYWSFKTNSEAKRWLEARTKAISASNANSGLEYAEKMQGMTTSQSHAMNGWGALDAAGIGGVASWTARTILNPTIKFGANAVMRKALQDSTKGVDSVTGKIDPVVQIAVTGDLKAATQAQITRDILKKADPFGQGYDVFEQARLITHPDLIAGVNAPAVVKQRANEITAKLADQSTDIATALTTGRFAERAPEVLIPKMVNEAESNFLAENYHLAGTILDKKIIINPLNHTRSVEFQLGDKGKLLFHTAEDAEKYAYKVYGFDFQRVVVKNEANEALLAGQKTRLSDNVVNKGMAVENARLAAAEGRPVPGPTKLQTSMGDSYTIHPNGTTTRMAKENPARPGVPVGEGQKSARTVYLTDKQIAEAAVPNAPHKFVENKDGTISVATRANGNTGKWEIGDVKIAAASQPSKGLIPLELFRKADSEDKKIVSQWIGKTPAYNSYHLGDKIVDIMKAEQDDIDQLLASLERGGATFLEGDKKLQVAEKALNEAATLEIKQEGAGWYISILKPLNETSPGLRADLIDIPTNNTNPVSLGNFFLGGLARSAEDQLAHFQRGARHIVTHIPQELMRVMTEIAQSIGALSKKDFKQLSDVISRDMNFSTMVAGKPVRGMAHTNQVALEKTWMDVNGTIPTAQQSLAYWSYHQLMAADWVMRNAGVQRDLLRQGVEHFSFTVGDATVFAPGRFEKTIPWQHKENFGILVNHDGNIEHFWSKSIPPRIRDKIDTMHENGQFKIVQIANPADRPFQSLEKPVKNTVNFVITNKYDSKPLPMNLVDWNPGVHVVYPQPFFVKQPIMAVGEKGLLRYYGDKVIFAVDNEKQALMYSKGISEVQRMLREKLPDADIQAFISKNLPEDLAHWKAMFTATDKADAFLSLEHPIGPVYTGKTFFDQHPHLKPTGLSDERASEFNLFGSINMDFMANRDGPLKTITRGGTPETPIYKLENARTLDPFKSLTRGLVTAVDSLVINDAKYAAIEQWVAQFKHLLPNAEESAANPFKAFYGFTPDKSLWTRPEVAAAVNTRERIMQFLGTSTELGKDMNYIYQKMMNSMSQKDPNKLSKLNPERYYNAQWYNDHELRAVKDPIAFTRAAMFVAKFVFAPAQFLVQGAGFFHVMAVAGVPAASRGVSGYMLSRMLRMTDEPAVIARLGNIAAKMGWGDSKTFIEAYKTMRSTGFDIIGKEHSMDGAFDPRIFKSGFDTALEWGRIPFTEGERLVRETAWYTAFHEWRKANPGKAVDNFSVGDIITRADDLSANMTKASHSRLQEGIFAVPTQFYTFSHRMLEQFWGGRLTPAEKIRAGLTHSALFGLPITAAIGIPWPINDSLKQTLMEDGSPLLENGWYKAATEGFLSWATHMVTGTEYNVEQRYGPGFSDYFKKLVGGELSAVEMLGGAAGSFLGSLTKSLYPFYAHVKIGMTGGQEEYPLVKEDIFEVLREMSGYNTAHNAYYAINTGKYFSRNGTFIQEGMTTTDAAMMILGLTRKDITDVRLMLGSIKEQKAAQQKVAVLAEREFKRAYIAMSDNDWDKADAHFMRAKALMVAVGDFKDDMIQTTLQRAMEEGTPLAQRIKKDFVDKGNKSQLPARLQRLYDSNATQPVK